MKAPNRPFEFKLRKEILNDGSALRDALTGAAYPLGDLGTAVIGAMVSPFTVDEIVSQVASARRVSLANVERELRQMFLLGLIDGACNHSRQRLERIRDGEVLPSIVLEGSRFSCQNSGACCRGYVFGSIREEEKTRIEALDPRKSLSQLGTDPLFIETGSGSGKPTYRLATKGDACVFLEDGPQCGLHRAFGATAKPALCQMYPLAAVATIEGLKIYDRGECATFAVSARTGTLLEDDAPRIRALVDESVYHPAVLVHGSWRCDYGLILALARRLDREANSKSNSTLQALHAMGHVARAFIVSLTRCPFEAGQPEAAVAQTLERSWEELRPSQAMVDANARSGISALGVLAEGLMDRTDPTDSLGPSFRETASLLAELCRGILGEGLISQRAAGARAIAMDADCEQAARLSLRQQLFGRELLLDDQLPAGLLRMALAITLTLAGARLRALKDGRQRALAHHFSASHMTTKRTLNRPEPHGLLRVNGEQVWPILDALPLLVPDLGFTPSP